MGQQTGSDDKAAPSALARARREWREFRVHGGGAACPHVTPSIGERAMAALVARHGPGARWDHFCARSFDAHLTEHEPTLTRHERFLLVGSMPMFLAYLAGKGRVPPRVVDRAFDDCDAIDPWA